MRRTALVLVFLVLTVTGILAQHADKDGVYAMGNGVKAPRLIHAVAPIRPADPRLATFRYGCILSAVIGVDGNAKEVAVAGKRPSPFDDAAILAVKQSRFEPGKVHSDAVPVRVQIWVPFLPGTKRALPEIFPLKDVQPPIPLKYVEPEFSDEAKRARLEGVVLVSTVVNEEGLPTDVHVVRPLGKGLDEKAVQAVNRYVFRPAMKDAMPVPMHVTIEVYFRNYRQ